MARSLIESYEEPIDHERASGIIQRCSSNPRDVRDFVLDGRDLSQVRAVLDLGCGFGFMAERLALRAHREAVLWGVDLCSANRREFLRRVRATGRSARFVDMGLTGTLPWPEGSFDLAACSYSLYFFPGLVPEIARVLRPGGRLMALTHTLASQRELLRAAGISEDVGPPLVQVVSRFSAENGPEILQPHFREVEAVFYENTLRFGEGDFAALASYLRFKLMLVGEGPGDPAAQSGRPVVDVERLRGLVRAGLEIRKDDMAFWCTR